MYPNNEDHFSMYSHYAISKDQVSYMEGVANVALTVYPDLPSKKALVPGSYPTEYFMSKVHIYLAVDFERGFLVIEFLHIASYEVITL